VTTPRFLQFDEATKSVIIGFGGLDDIHAVIDLHHIVTVRVGFNNFAETHIAVLFDW
jgi:hypothetical protein